MFLTTSQLLDLLGFDVSEITQTHMGTARGHRGTGWVRETLDHEFTTTRSTPSAAVTRTLLVTETTVASPLCFGALCFCVLASPAGRVFCLFVFWPQRSARARAVFCVFVFWGTSDPVHLVW